MSHRKYTPEQDAEIAELRAGGMTIAALCRQFGGSLPAMRASLARSGLATNQTGRPRGPQRRKVYRGKAMGERHGMWKGGRFTTKQGYVWLRVRDDTPFPEMAHGHGYIPEHRLVMAISLGRPLTDSETVHHVNGDKADNRPENLQLRQGRHGNGEAFVCADCGSHNIVPMTLT